MSQYDQLDLLANGNGIIPPHLQQQGYLLYRRGIRWMILISPDNKFWSLKVATGELFPYPPDGTARTYEQVKAGIED
jgi:hypothetical protein